MLPLFDPRETVPELLPLRPRQSAVMDAVRQAVREGHKRIVVQAPTGAGKTVLAAHLMNSSAQKGRRPLFVAPAIALVEQTLASFERQGIGDIGVIQAQHHRTDWKAQVQIASRDTLVRRPLPEVGFVIVDEVHDERSSLNAIIDGEAWKDKVVIGLSATPWTRGMGLRYTKLIVMATVKDMIAEGGLSPYKLWGPDDSFEPSDKGLKVGGNGEFQDSAAAKVMGDQRIVGDAVESWLRRRQANEHCGDRCFLYGVNRAHAKSLMEAFQAQGVSCGYIDGESTREERQRAFGRYRSREDKILCNVGVLITGVDEDVRSIIDCAIRASEINWVQAFGRGLRLAEGKDYLRHYDHGGNWQRLGLPDDIHHEELDDREPGSKKDPFEEEKPTPKPRKCKQCNAIVPPRSKACPACGSVPKIENTVMHEKGELVEVSSDSRPPAKVKKDKKSKASPEERQEFYSGFLGIAKDRGYSEGWAAWKFKEKFSVFPRNLEKVASLPSAQVQAYERHLRIKYAKSKQQTSNNA